MAKFLIYAWDDTDADALARRMKVRPDHFKMATELKAKGHFIIGGAMLGEEGEMKGSMMIVDFPSRKELDEWLEIEPYLLGNVWKEIEVHDFRIADVK